MATSGHQVPVGVALLNAFEMTASVRGRQAHLGRLWEEDAGGQPSHRPCYELLGDFKQKRQRMPAMNQLTGSVQVALRRRRGARQLARTAAAVRARYDLMKNAAELVLATWLASFIAVRCYRAQGHAPWRAAPQTRSRTI